MNRKYHLIWVLPLVLGFSVAGAQELPEPADDEARNAVATQGLPADAADGLAIAAEKTAGLPEEATIRLMDDADEEDAEAVTHEVSLPTLPDEGASGQQGLDIAGQAMADGEAFGRRQAEDARENAADAAENAQDAAEGRSRAEDLPVDVPGRPDVPVDPPITPPTP